MRSTRRANSTFMMKCFWEFCTNHNSLWGSIIRSKYKCGRSTFPKIDLTKKGSNFRNGLSVSWKDFRNLLIVDFGNEDDTLFWLGLITGFVIVSPL